ncbi:MAG: hypothetical protein IPN49_16520 [Saprospiraceae bacterium]|nr:hypothetical protein [Saprospiraceae bacterium]
MQSPYLMCNKNVNPEFDNGSSNYLFYSSNGAAATMSINNGSQLSGVNSAFIDVTTPGTEDWHISLESNAYSFTR